MKPIKSSKLSILILSKLKRMIFLKSS